jgi:hypothetical protein
MPVSAGVRSPIVPAGPHLAPILGEPMSVQADCLNKIRAFQQKEYPMRKSVPDMMFSDPERSRFSMLRTWVLDNGVTEIVMKELQFWNFSQLQPVAEKPWSTFMGRAISVPDMPVEAQKYLGIFDKRTVGAI